MKPSSNKGNYRILSLVYIRITIETEIAYSSKNLPGITFLTFKLLIIQGYSLFQ